MQRLASLLALPALAGLSAAPLHAQWSTASLSTPRQSLVAVSVGSKALFAGGRVGNTTLNAVDIYDSSMGAPNNPAAWTTGTLSVGRTSPSATALGNLAFIGGGAINFNTMSAVVDVYDASSGTWSTAAPLSIARGGMSAASVGTYVIFAGGFAVGPAGVTASNRVDFYDSSLGAPSNPAAWKTTSLTAPRGAMAAVTVGSKVIFAGGQDVNSPSAVVDIYDSLVGDPSFAPAWSTATLSQARNFLNNAAAVSGSRAWFAGGQTGQFTPPSAAIDVYDDVSGTWSTTSLSSARSHLGVAALNGQVLFAGGLTASAATPVVDALNASSDAWAFSAALPQGHFDRGTTTVGGMVLFAGGATASGASAVVDVYQPLGVVYCSAAPNSTGARVGISASGSASLAANDLVLNAYGVPNTPFLFFHGSTRVQTPFGNGYLCAGGGVRRIPPAATAVGGLAQLQVDLNAAQITTPGVHNFQCWYRDPGATGATTNTSDAIEITILP